MFYPLEAIFANKNIYFAGKKDLLCSYCCSLLEFYDPEKTEQRLEAPYFSILAGIGIGKLTSYMFVPMLQASYATSEQVLPMKLITRASDLYRLYGIVACVMLVCVALLIILLFRMNVTKALKLGEE